MPCAVNHIATWNGLALPIGCSRHLSGECCYCKPAWISNTNSKRLQVEEGVITLLVFSSFINKNHLSLTTRSEFGTSYAYWNASLRMQNSSFFNAGDSEPEEWTDNGVVEYWSIGKWSIQPDRNLKVFTALHHSNTPIIQGNSFRK